MVMALGIQMTLTIHTVLGGTAKIMLTSVVRTQELDSACIDSDCLLDDVNCDSMGRCVHYDQSDSTWKCGHPGYAENEEEKTMLRGETVTKEE